MIIRLSEVFIKKYVSPAKYVESDRVCRHKKEGSKIQRRNQSSRIRLFF